jgi:hypothetical protein
MLTDGEGCHMKVYVILRDVETVLGTDDVVFGGSVCSSPERAQAAIERLHVEAHGKSRLHRDCKNPYYYEEVLVDSTD